MKNLTKDYFELLNFIPSLLRYFALSPDNRVTCKAIVPTTKITYYQDDEGKFHKIIDLGWKDKDPTYEPMDCYEPMEFKTIEAIIYQLESLPGTKYNFKNMKEQVRAMSTAYACMGDYPR